MTLQNLLKIGRLKTHQPSAAEVQRLLAAINRNLLDAAATNISDETRFDVAYKAVMQCALAAMPAAGYRPAANEPGHHLKSKQLAGGLADFVTHWPTHLGRAAGLL